MQSSPYPIIVEISVWYDWQVHLDQFKNKKQQRKTKQTNWQADGQTDREANWLYQRPHTLIYKTQQCFHAFASTRPILACNATKFQPKSHLANCKSELYSETISCTISRHSLTRSAPQIPETWPTNTMSFLMSLNLPCESKIFRAKTWTMFYGFTPHVAWLSESWIWIECTTGTIEHVSTIVQA